MFLRLTRSNGPTRFVRRIRVLRLESGSVVATMTASFPVNQVPSPAEVQAVITSSSPLEGDNTTESLAFNPTSVTVTGTQNF